MVAMATSVEGSDKLLRINDIQTNTFHLLNKIVKIGPVDPEIPLLNFKKKKVINASKTYSLVGKFARRYAKRGICRRRVSVCLSVCLSHFGIVSKRLNIGSRK